jgi:hypothetical protein
MLISMYHADEERKALLRQDQERRAIEDDRRRRASIWRGQPVVDGLSGSEALLAAAAADNPFRRVSPVEEALGGNRDVVTIRPHSSVPAEWFPEDEAAS